MSKLEPLERECHYVITRKVRNAQGNWTEHGTCTNLPVYFPSYVNKRIFKYILHVLSLQVIISDGSSKQYQARHLSCNNKT